ncbi:hypothetical protein IFM89_007111 [Coptis chinensis]|uniref:Uncharacterized protein n=1 Tax=Coptis chinensis TaxID=261450 RepID=A0A835H222_9MAGN|nr:hypothetical protein IFM89_007111 [Coptis chinensis]
MHWPRFNRHLLCRMQPAPRLVYNVKLALGFFNMTGYSSTEVIGRNWYALLLLTTTLANKTEFQVGDNGYGSYSSKPYHGVYVNYSEKFKNTWEGLSMECFKHVLPSMKLAIPSAVMVWDKYKLCFIWYSYYHGLESWAFELLVLLAGLMPNSENSTSLIAMWLGIMAMVHIHQSHMQGEMLIPANAVGKVMGRGRGNLANISKIIRDLSYLDTIVAWAAAYHVHPLQSMMPNTAGASEKGNEVCVKPMASRRLPRIAPSDIILPGSLGDGAQNSDMGDRVENPARRRCYIYYSSDENDAPPITTRHPDPSLRSCSSDLYSP